MADICEQVGGNIDDVVARHGQRQSHRPCLPEARSGLWRVLFSEGHAGDGAHRREDCSVRRRSSKRSSPSTASRTHRMVAKIVQAAGDDRARKAHRPSRPHLQAQHRRRARQRAVLIADELRRLGAMVRAYDPKGMEQARSHPRRRDRILRMPGRRGHRRASSASSRRNGTSSGTEGRANTGI